MQVPLKDLLRQPRKVWVVRGNVEVQAPERVVHLDRDRKGEDTGDVDVKVAGEVEVDQALGLGEELSEGDGAFRGEVGAVEEDALEVRVDGDRGPKRRDLPSRCQYYSLVKPKRRCRAYPFQAGTTAGVQTHIERLQRRVEFLRTQLAGSETNPEKKGRDPPVPPLSTPTPGHQSCSRSN